MSGSAEYNPLHWDDRIRLFRVIGCDEIRHIDQAGWVGRLSCKRADFH
jgi:hypothetical protein